VVHSERPTHIIKDEHANDLTLKAIKLINYSCCERKEITVCCWKSNCDVLCFKLKSFFFNNAN